MIAIIPVAGAGIRLRPHTYTQPKPLIPVAGKTIISFIIEQLQDVGIEDFVFIIGYLGEKIKLYLEEHYPDINKTFVYQEQRQGLGHAIWMAKEAVEGYNEIFIALGDTICVVDLQKMINQETSSLGVKKVEDPRNFGVVEYNEDKIVKRVIEKPKIPKSNMAMVGLYKIKEVRELYNALEYNIKNEVRTYDEFQLTDAIMKIIEDGAKFSTVTVNNWFDCGKKEILLETNATLLDKDGYASDDLPPYDNSIIIHPVSIGKNCKISNSIIGPHATIGDNVKISYSIVKESIIGNFASINQIVLHQSVIGSDTAIKGSSKSLNIGDNTEIDFS